MIFLFLTIAETETEWAESDLDIDIYTQALQRTARESKTLNNFYTNPSAWYILYNKFSITLWKAVDVDIITINTRMSYYQ